MPEISAVTMHLPVSPHALFPRTVLVPIPNFPLKGCLVQFSAHRGFRERHIVSRIVYFYNVKDGSDGSRLVLFSLGGEQ